MSKALKQNSVRPQPSPVEKTRLTLATPEGQHAADIRLLAQHVESPKGNFIKCELIVSNAATPLKTIWFKLEE